MKTVKEGLVSLHLPDSSKEAFYNPGMELSRDISVAFLQAVGIKDAVLCDLLSAAGARAVRYAKETGAASVVANDASESAVKYIKENAAVNGVSDKVIVSCKGANAFLEDNPKKFDFIDIDPFGSPVYFLDKVAENAKRDSYLAITATDCGALAGIFSKTCEERYGVKLERTECFKEVGVRNLIGVVATHFGSQSLSVRPLLSHATAHYFRVFLQVAEGGGDYVKKFYYCRGCGMCTFDQTRGKTLCDICGAVPREMGPVWAGRLRDKKICFEILGKLGDGNFNKPKEARRIIMSMIDEDDTPFYHDIHRISKRIFKNTPPMPEVISRLKKLNFSATRTQFSGTSVKTDAGIARIEKIIQLLDKQGPRKRPV
ncbi:MAG: hypothetical protein HYS53_02745 [Candidatus Aenigmarchaeota archaeon]|nr:hypothetical protein [Candidatus Aenigmarchaeota archaeon]